MSNVQNIFLTATFFRNIKLKQSEQVRCGQIQINILSQIKPYLFPSNYEQHSREGADFGYSSLLA